MSSVGFSAKLPSVQDFLANQGMFIDSQILNSVISATNAEVAASSIRVQTAQLKALSGRSAELAATQVSLGSAVPETVKAETKAADDLSNNMPTAPVGATPNLAQWDQDHPLTYSDDAVAQFLKARGLPVAVYVPEQKKIIQTEDGPVTLTAEAIGDPNAAAINQQTLADYKAALADGSADNPAVNAALANSAGLQGASSGLQGSGVAAPTKLSEVAGAIGSMNIVLFGLAARITQSRADLGSVVRAAAENLGFLNTLGDDLNRSARSVADRLQRKLSEDIGAPGFAALDPETDAVVTEILGRLDAAALSAGDLQATLAALPDDQRREALKQSSAFKESLEAILGTAAPATAAPPFQASPRMVRV
jgi:hypothetical protein